MNTIITTHYEHGMGSFLDERKITWKKIDKPEDSIQPNEVAIQIIFDRKLTPNELWEFALEWKAWYIRIIL